MDLREIAAITGKPGLYRILKPNKNGVIVESLDAAKTRVLAPATSKISILSEITMYTTDAEGSIPLPTVFVRIHEKYAGKLTITAKSAASELQALMADVVPDYDSEKVYTSDLKKLVTWYSIIAEFAPEAFVEKQEEAAAQ
jgi:hypothetical protein